MARPSSVLLVDDDEALTQILREVLLAQGYDVWTANNGVQGYDSYYRHPADIVVTDIQMPEMNGFEMMRCIRSLNPSVRTIYVSGSAEYFHDSLECEGRAFNVASLHKPFSARALLDLMSAQSGVGSHNQ